MSEIPEDIMDAARSVAMKIAAVLPVTASDDVDRIARAILAERERHGWQSIETAPRDWTDIILYVPDDDDGSGSEGVCQGWFSMEDGGFNCWMTSNGPVEPTYWHPLPSPPKP